MVAGKDISYEYYCHLRRQLDLPKSTNMLVDCWINMSIPIRLTMISHFENQLNLTSAGSDVPDSQVEPW